MHPVSKIIKGYHIKVGYTVSGYQYQRAVSCLERLLLKMTYYVSSGTLTLLHCSLSQLLLLTPTGVSSVMRSSVCV